MTIFSAHYGVNNADVIAAAAELYIKDGARVADVTYGKGAFWKKTKMGRFSLLKTDITDGVDFRRLPYTKNSLDVIVLDPPYVHNPGHKMITNARYNNRATTGGMYHRDILELYKSGMIEAKRVLKPGGQLWIKCKDEIESSIQKWSHIELYQIAESLNLYAKDLFILIPSSRTNPNRWANQFHARKNHSYLWIFKNAETKS